MKFYYLYISLRSRPLGTVKSGVRICKGTLKTIASAERFGESLDNYTIECNGKVVASK